MKTQSRPSGERTTFAPTEERAPNRAVATTSGTLPVRTSGPTGAAAGATAGAVPAERAPGGPISWLTLENGLYLLFFALALITRFWDLGAKGLHHDESLHSVYSWKYYMDQGYIHSPMMHGPEQFHFIDLFYLLFGATDATARFASATCGVFLVMAPWFLRRQLGRWPALIASFLLLISPGFMYFTRFAREDAIYAAMEMLFVMGLWRFVDERKPRDFYIMCAGYSLMFTIKESAYLTTAVIGLLLVTLFAWQTGKVLFATLIGYLVVLGGAALYILKVAANVPKMPSIPDQDPSPANISAFVSALLGHPLIQAAGAITLVWIGVWAFLILDQRRRLSDTIKGAAMTGNEAEYEETEPEPALEPAAYSVNGNAMNGNAGGNGHSAEDLPDDSLAEGLLMEDETEGEPAAAPIPAPKPRTIRRRAARGPAPAVSGMLDLYQPGSLPYAVGYLFRNPLVLGTGLAIAVLLYVALYTSMFTNINGIGTGLFGSIGYWLAQQDVRRGDQPWVYYMLLIPIYEPLIIFFGFVGMVYFAVKGFQSQLASRGMRPQAERLPGATQGFNVGKAVEFAEFRPFLVLFLSVWFIGVFSLYSWAGEKMPWLMTHMVHPLAFLAALALGQLIKSMIRNRHRRATGYVLPEAEEVRPGRRRAVMPVVSPMETVAGPVSWVPFFSFLSLFVIVSIFWAMNITHRVMNSDYGNWWQLLIWPALLLLLVAAYWTVVGGGRVMRYVMVGVMLLLAVYGLRSALVLSFQNEMDAREMAVYVQTSPEVTRAADAIDRLSVDQTGARDLKVSYDSLASWPWEWYLRDYKNKQFLGGDGPTTAPGPDVAVLVVDSSWYDKVKAGQAPQLSNYVGTKYPMRWWFPEDTYRNFVPTTWDELNKGQPAKPDGSPNYAVDAAGKQIKAPVRQMEGALDTIAYTLRTPSEQGKLWKYLIYREPYAALGSTDFAVFVRKDLVNRYNYLQSLHLPNYDSTLSH